LYFPTEKVNHNYDRESFNNENEYIDVVVLNKGKKKAILYFGGNGESVICNANDFLTALPSYTVYLLNYRGYGGSTGKPEEQAIYSDALCLFDRVQKYHLNISVIGRSLGSGVATFLATKRTIEKLALVTPYDSMESVAQNRLLIYPMVLLLKDKYDSLSRVKYIKVKTLAIIAENDKVIPRKHSVRLVKEFPSTQISVKIINGVGHNDLSDKKEYYNYLRNFFEN